MCAFCRLVDKAALTTRFRWRWCGEGDVDDRRVRYGDKVLVLDTKGRRYLATLKEGGEFHTHAGFVAHTELIGQPEGVVVRSTKGSEYTVLRPTLEDFVIEMPRGAQVIYPKDLGPICMLADIGPGVRVLESGVGSGALSMTMLRSGADIVGYEMREDFANRARRTCDRSSAGGCSTATTSTSGLLRRDRPELALDRVVLDLPEPWQVVPKAEASLQAGGILVAYTPSIIQAVQVGRRSRGVDGPPDHRGPAPELAHRGPRGAPRPPDGRPHRLPDGGVEFLGRQPDLRLSVGRRRQRSPSVRPR